MMKQPILTVVSWTHCRRLALFVTSPCPVVKRLVLPIVSLLISVCISLVCFVPPDLVCRISREDSGQSGEWKRFAVGSWKSQLAGPLVVSLSLVYPRIFLCPTFARVSMHSDLREKSLYCSSTFLNASSLGSIMTATQVIHLKQCHSIGGEQGQDLLLQPFSAS